MPESIRDSVPSQSKTGKAITYCLNQETYLREFLNDGNIPIDNNAAERSIRSFCLGKKNWYVIDTIHGAEASAIAYSIAETAKENNLRPYEYFEHLFEVIPQHPPSMVSKPSYEMQKVKRRNQKVISESPKGGSCFNRVHVIYHLRQKK